MSVDQPDQVKRRESRRRMKTPGVLTLHKISSILESEKKSLE
jgi:hypothetical protein